MERKIYPPILTSCIVGLFGLISFSYSVAQTQTFVDGYIPQTIITTPITACSIKKNYAFYDKSQTHFKNTSNGAASAVIRYVNDGTANSSKILIYNPYGMLSTTGSLLEKDSFINGFYYYSNIKPKNVTQVYSTYQSKSTYFVGNSGTVRDTLAGQIVFDIWYRYPKSVVDGGTAYTYTTIDDVQHTINYTLTWDASLPRQSGGYLCSDMYIGRCGDGVVDSPEGAKTSDGLGGLQTTAVGFLPWSLTGFTAEFCDSGANNSDTVIGACKTDCSGIVGTTTEGRCGDNIIQENPQQDLNGDSVINGEDLEKCDNGDANGFGSCKDNCFTKSDLVADLILDPLGE